MKLYAARDKNTGELINHLTNPHRKFWEKRGMCENAINNKPYLKELLEVVEFELVEVKPEQ